MIKNEQLLSQLYRGSLQSKQEISIKTRFATKPIND